MDELFKVGNLSSPEKIFLGVKSTLTRLDKRTLTTIPLNQY